MMKQKKIFFMFRIFLCLGLSAALLLSGTCVPAVGFFLRLDEADRTVVYSVEGEQSLRYAGE